MLICGLAPVFSNGQEVTDSTGFKPPASTYTRYPAAESTGAISTIGQNDFNQGYIADPTQLIPGKLAGVQVYNRGGNPNTASLMRVRGLSAYAQRQPLFIVDGLAGASLDNLDPNDIAEISVLRDGSAQALYGMRASNGVVLIRTQNAASAHRPLSVQYTGQLAVATPYDGIPVMDAPAFREAGGLDLGSATDWQEEIVRNGLSQNHGLALQGKLPNSNTRYRISGNYRQAEGVLRHSGFDQTNVRAHVSSDFGLDRLSWQLSTAYANRNSQLGLPEAFGFASLYNPTAPVFSTKAPFAYNTEQYGGYFELLGLLQGFNPRAMVELNERDRQRQTFNASSLLSYALNDRLDVNFRYGYQNQSENFRAFYSPESLYFGNAFGLRAPKGRADLYDEDESLALYEFFANLRIPFGESQLSAMVGSSYSDIQHDDRTLSLLGIDNNNRLGAENIGDFSDWLGEDTAVRDSLFNGWRHQLMAYFGQAHLNIKDRYFFDLSLRYEGSSRLGENSQWGWFPALGAGVDFAHHFPKVDQLKFRLGYGLTGALPDRAGLAKERIETIIDENGEVGQTTMRYSNPDLKWEAKSEINLGVDLQMGALSAFANWYQRDISDWVILDDEPRFGGSTLYVNANALQASGIELGIDLNLVASNRLSYNTGLRLSTYQVEYAELRRELVFLSTSCCAQPEPLIMLKEGEQVGDLQGPTFSGEVDAEGDQVFTDLNGDGQINTAADQIFSPESDLAVLGNGLPDMELGWWHQLRYGQWELQAFFRATLGHSLVNRPRQLWEPRSPYATASPYNFVNTDLAIEELRSYQYSSLYVEQADFLKLDYLSLSRRFAFKNKSQQPITLSLTLQNLLLASRYSGTDPEPALENRPATLLSDPFNPRAPDPLSPGIDRMINYRPAVSVVFGVRAVF
ncbi:MAG: SusC/RagA family TonB-linked outer membrane protein [Bacteroidetes bacterium]|nr:SusC/RagA family TonB-linked outer membrane protein [Bacteroidota bacterium]